MRTAIVIGITGLVGKAVVQTLLHDAEYSKVVGLARRATEVKHPKYEEHVIDFAKPESFAALVKGDVLFSSLGTTRGQAGSVEAQRLVDYTYQFEVAKLAAKNGVKTCVLVSSSGANADSALAYLKMKGELERDVKQLGFASLHIVQPGPLTGARDKTRLGEEISVGLINTLNLMGLFRSMRPITGDQVAQAMVRAAALPGVLTHGPTELFSLANQYRAGR